MTTTTTSPQLFDMANQSHQLLHETPFNQAELDLLFIYIMRMPAIFNEAKAHLRPEYFDAVEAQYAVFWATVVDLEAQYHHVTYEMVAAEIQRRTASSHALSADVVYQVIREDREGLAYSVMLHPLTEQLSSDHARDLLRRFLHERTVARPITRIMSQSRGGSYPRNVMQLIDQASAQFRRIDAIRNVPIGGLMPQRGSPLPAPMQYTPTGLSFVDPYIKGQRKGDANGILGVFGSGKTTFGVQLALENAQNSYNAYLTGQAERPGLNVFLSYEEPESKVNKRLWAYAARIRRDKLETLQDWNQLTTPANIEPYERELSAAGVDGVIYSESERWDMAMPWYNSSFRLFDMSGSENFPAAGSGGVAEIVAMLSRLVEETGQPINSIVADYAGLICRRQMQTNNVSEEKTRFHLQSIGDDFRRQIAERFQCTAWLLHQFNGDQNKRSPTTLLHHSDASESKAFAENLAVCGCLGVEDKSTGCRLLNWSKVRYFQDRSQSAPTLQIDGRFGSMVDVSNRYVPDPGTSTFVDPQSRHTLEGDTVAAPRRVGRGPVGLRAIDGSAGDMGFA